MDFDFISVIATRALTQRVFTLPEIDPRFMPVTRDLSRSQREMIFTWLDNPVR